MVENSPRGELRLTLDFEGQRQTVRGLLRGHDAAQGLTGGLGLLPALVDDLQRALRRRQQQEARDDARG